MPVMTIKTVQDTPRPWGDKFPDSCSACVQFEDGSSGEVASKKTYVQTHIDALKGLVGHPGEFDLEDKGEYRGVKQWKIKNYPGKPQSGSGFGGGGGGKREYVPRWKDTEEGTRAEQDSIHRSVALTQAVASLNLTSGPSQDQTDWVLKTADHYYEWLSKHSPPAAPKATELASGVPGTTTANKMPPPQIKPDKSTYELYLEAVPQYTALSDVMAACEKCRSDLRDGQLDDSHYRKLVAMMARQAILVCPKVRTPEPAFRACEQFLMKLNKEGQISPQLYGELCLTFAETEAQWESQSELRGRF